MDREFEQEKTKDLTILKDINFEAKEGNFIAVVGNVASCKTSFLTAMIGGLS